MINQKYHLLKKGGKVKKSKQKQKQKQSQRQTNTQIVKVNVHTSSRRKRTNAKRSSTDKQEQTAKPHTSISVSMPAYNPAFSQIPNANKGFNIQDIQQMYNMFRQQNDDRLRSMDVNRQELEPQVEVKPEPIGARRPQDNARMQLLMDLYDGEIKEDEANEKIGHLVEIYRNNLGNVTKALQHATREEIEEMIEQGQQLKHIASRKAEKSEKDNERNKQKRRKKEKGSG